MRLARRRPTRKFSVAETRGLMENRPKTMRRARIGWLRKLQTFAKAYKTDFGVSLIGESETVLKGARAALHGRVQLVFTSPPFPLNRKKAYDNRQGEEYKAWLKSFAPLLRDVLTNDGSIVIEVGNSWEPGLPVMSTLALESLLAFKEHGQLHLCQEFIWYNPAKLPTPAQWVTVKRVRVKDAFTRLWWMSPTPYPHADNSRVLQAYSRSMRKLLERRKYNAGRRPSEHDISQTSFLTDNGGAIPPNVVHVEHAPGPIPESVLVGANTGSGDAYSRRCRELNIRMHPARMAPEVAEFFINLCTRPGDLVLDPFAGSNTTGAAAERLGREWLSVEANPAYARAGHGRFATQSALPLEAAGLKVTR